MKKILMLSAGVMLISSVTLAQNEMAVKKQERNQPENDNVGYLTKQQFIADFDGVTEATWHRTGDYDIACFVQDGVNKSAYYDAGSKLIGTVEARTFSDLPEKAQHYIHKKWSGYEVMHVIYFDDNEWSDTDMLLYGEQFNDEDNYFIELSKGNDKVILRSDLNGETDFFSQVK